MCSFIMCKYQIVVPVAPDCYQHFVSCFLVRDNILFVVRDDFMIEISSYVYVEMDIVNCVSITVQLFLRTLVH